MSMNEYRYNDIDIKELSHPDLLDLCEHLIEDQIAAVPRIPEDCVTEQESKTLMDWAFKLGAMTGVLFAGLIWLLLRLLR